MKAHRLLHHSTLASRVMKKKKKRRGGGAPGRRSAGRSPPRGGGGRAGAAKLSLAEAGRGEAEVPTESVLSNSLRLVGEGLHRGDAAGGLPRPQNAPPEGRERGRCEPEVGSARCAKGGAGGGGVPPTEAER